MTTGKTIDLSSQAVVGKVMSLFFNMLSRLVIAVESRHHKELDMTEQLN